MNDPILIDECLSPKLAAFAHERGHQATHVVYRGLPGTPDERLMKVIRSEGAVFVTSNRRDFLRLYRNEALHAGLIILVPGNLPWLEQTRFFALALDVVEAHPDLTNTLVEVLSDGSVAVTPYP